MPNAVQYLADRVARSRKPAVDVPPVDLSFHAWLHQYARVRMGHEFVPYTVAGRRPLFACILIIDYILGNDCSYADTATRRAVLGSDRYGVQLSDARLEICGGAQFGKTILMLLLKAYLASVKFRNMLYALPDDDLVESVIDLKERPEVIDQIPYVGKMLAIGKGLTESGRAVNRKGAMLYTDGTRTAVSMMRGLGKVPTTFSADVVAVDERDDVREEFADFLTGRMSASDLRLSIDIGTQRYHGAGQNALFLEGSQHVGMLRCGKCGSEFCTEEEWPGIVRSSETGKPSPQDPQLDSAGTFRRAGAVVGRFHPEFHYYFACTSCGQPLDREAIVYRARQPEMIAARHWSVRVSQMGCSALGVDMFVAEWCGKAVRKSDKMIAFNCDRLAIPKSTGQKLTPAVLDRAAAVAPYPLTMPGVKPLTGVKRYAGLDTGDLCWLVVRERTEHVSRLAWAESIADSETRVRAVALFDALKLNLLFVDAGPLRDLARDLALSLNGLDEFDVGAVPNWEKARIQFKGGVVWDGEHQVWLGLKCAPVEFSLKPGGGIRHQARLTPDNRHIYPVISCNRDEAIQGVVDDLLTAEEGLAVVGADGTLRTQPVFTLPRTGSDEPAIVDLYRKHLLIGSRKERDRDGKEEHFIDQVPNHLLLATAYARLAESIGGGSASSLGTACGRVTRQSRGEVSTADRKQVLL